MIKYKFVIAYEGTFFSGWQTQHNSLSIQATIEKALCTIFKTSITIVGSGRTDAGVHALGQVAHFQAIKQDCKKLQRSINAILPSDIRILNVEEANPLFHARYSAIGKEYHYHIDIGRTIDPFTLPYAYYCRNRIDIEKLREAASYFIGTHDFSAFANGPPTTLMKKNCIRTISKLDIQHQDDKIRLRFIGNGFLYKMVRNITGTLLQVAKGKISCEEIPGIFASKNRMHVTNPAPPQGLFLMKVFYPKEL